MKLIDKSALVAEIEKRQSIVLDPLNNNIHTKRLEETYKSILSFINTLEVKEVEVPVSKDLEEVADKYLVEKGYLLTTNNGEHLAEVEAKGLFKAGAQWQKEQDAIEVKEVDLDNYVKGRIYYPFVSVAFPIIYPNYKELKDFCDKNGIKDEDKIKIIIIKDE